MKLLVTMLVGDEKNIEANHPVRKPNEDGELFGKTVVFEDWEGSDHVKNIERFAKAIKNIQSSLARDNQ